MWKLSEITSGYQVKQYNTFIDVLGGYSADVSLAVKNQIVTYFMQTQVWQIIELQRIERKTRKIMVENGAKHPQVSTESLYLPRIQGREG